MQLDMLHIIMHEYMHIYNLYLRTYIYIYIIYIYMRHALNMTCIYGVKVVHCAFVQIMERDLVQELSPDLLYFDSIEYVLQVS